MYFLLQNESESYPASFKNLDHSLAKAGHVEDKYIPYSTIQHSIYQNKVKLKAGQKSKVNASHKRCSVFSGPADYLIIIMLNINRIEDQLFANLSLAFYLTISL